MLYLMHVVLFSYFSVHVCLNFSSTRASTSVFFGTSVVCEDKDTIFLEFAELFDFFYDTKGYHFFFNFLNALTYL